MFSSSPPGPNLAGGHGRPVSGSSRATPSASLPSAPGGVPGVRLTDTPPSLEPNPSTTRQPNLSANAARSPGAPSLP